MQLQPANCHNKSVTHNLMKRSLGLPHIFHITNCKDSPLVSAPPPQLRTSQARLSPTQLLRKGYTRRQSRRRDGSTAGRKGPVDHNTRRRVCKVRSPLPLGSYSSRRLALSLKPVVANVSFSKLLKTDVMYPVPAPLPPNISKIFSSAWLDDNHVLLGTKCHKLLVYDIHEQRFDPIETLSGDFTTSAGSVCPKHPPGCFGGMRAIALNPSHTLVATCGRDCSSVAVYRLPSLAPLVLAQGVHTSWIFDLSWLNDTKLAVGSRDGRMTIWNFTSQFNNVSQTEPNVQRKTSSSIVTEFEPTPLDEVNSINASDGNGVDFPAGDGSERLGYALTSKCMFNINCDCKVRALECYNKTKIVALDSRGQVNFFDINRMSKAKSLTVPGCTDNTCLTFDCTRQLIAIGSCRESFVLDVREQRPIVMVVPLPSPDSAFIRSLCFCENFLSMGTGTGDLYFLDVRNCHQQKVAYYDTHFSTANMRSHHGDRLAANAIIPDQIMYTVSRSHNIYQSDTTNNNLVHDNIFPFRDRYLAEEWEQGNMWGSRPEETIIHPHVRPLTFGLSDVSVGRIVTNDDEVYSDEEEQENNSSDQWSNSNMRARSLRNPLMADRFYFLNTPLQPNYIPFDEYLDLNSGRLTPTSDSQMSIYTHCFNKNKSLIFAAGGPLASTENGAFCTLYV